MQSMPADQMESMMKQSAAMMGKPMPTMDSNQLKMASDMMKNMSPEQMNDMMKAAGKLSCKIELVPGAWRCALHTALLFRFRALSLSLCPIGIASDRKTLSACCALLGNGSALCSPCY